MNKAHEAISILRGCCSHTNLNDFEVAAGTLIVEYLNSEDRNRKIKEELERYAEQLKHEELLSDTGKWIANRVVLECIKIVEKGKTDADKQS